jgi:hypothetical protein
MFREGITCSAWIHATPYYVIVTSHRDYPCEKTILGYKMGWGGGRGICRTDRLSMTAISPSDAPAR